jgi:hypothetical protein
MTSNHSTRTDAERLQAMLNYELQGHELSKAELAEARLLAPRVAAQQLAEAVAQAMRGELAIEMPLRGVWHGLSIADSSDPATRILGYAVALRTLLAAPELLPAVVKHLYDELLETAPTIDMALTALGCEG